jgi:hypothetical protein
MYLWRFNVEMKKFVDIDESEKNEEKEKQDIDDDGYRTILAVNEGIIIPAEIDFYDDEGMGIISSYSSAEDLCDCISEDLLTAYKAVTDKEELGISKEICEELKIDEFDSSSSPIMYIQDISFVDKKYLNLFLKMLGTISEGLPCRGYCKLVVILLKWSEEADTAKVFLDCGWKLKPADGGTVVAYGKI